MSGLPYLCLSLLYMHLIPGQDRLLVIHHSLQAGKYSGIRASVGIAMSSALTLIACIIIMSMHQSFASVFRIIGIIGGLYLVFLALSIAGVMHKFFENPPSARDIITTKPLVSGFLIHLLNPLAYIFPLTLFPPYLEEIKMQGVILVAAGSVLAGFIWNTLFGFLAAHFGTKLYSTRARKVLSIITALLFLVIAFRTIEHVINEP